MAFDLALADTLRPHIFRGEVTAWHAALSVTYVERYKTSISANALVMQGIARFSGNIDPPAFDPTTGTMTVGGLWPM